MNDDAFEKKLAALMGASGRPDHTPAWKADILARALREAEATPFDSEAAPLTRLAPPRWLMLSWAAAWIAILVLGFTTPRETTPGAARRVAAAPAKAELPHAPGAEFPTPTLFAIHQYMNQNLDLP